MAGPRPLPPYLTTSGLRAAIANSREVQEALGVPLLLEFPGFSHGTAIGIGTLHVRGSGVRRGGQRPPRRARLPGGAAPRSKTVERVRLDEVLASLLFERSFLLRAEAQPNGPLKPRRYTAVAAA